MVSVSVVGFECRILRMMGTYRTTMIITSPMGDPTITLGRQNVRLNRSSTAPSVQGLARSSRHTHCLSESVSA